MKIINNDPKPLLTDHIKSNSKQKEIFIDSINCVQDYIHFCISLGSDQSIEKVVHLLKGESSHWINKNKLIRGRFEWQDDYIAVSVSKSILDKVRKYIANQEEHNRNKSFLEGLEEFNKKYGFDVT